MCNVFKHSINLRGQLVQFYGVFLCYSLFSFSEFDALHQPNPLSTQINVVFFALLIPLNECKRFSRMAHVHANIAKRWRGVEMGKGSNKKARVNSTKQNDSICLKWANLIFVRSKLHRFKQKRRVISITCNYLNLCWLIWVWFCTQLYQCWTARTVQKAHHANEYTFNLMTMAASTTAAPLTAAFLSTNSCYHTSTAA